MAFRVPGPHSAGSGRQAVMPRWPRYVVPIAILLVLLGILVSVAAGIWTDYLWFSSVGQTRVFDTTYGTKWILFLAVAVFMIIIVGANIGVAYRLRPDGVPIRADRQAIEAYRHAIDPHRRGVLAVILFLTGLVSGLVAASAWRTWLTFVNRVPFGVKDPQFHVDLSFFVFDYPFLRLVLSFLFGAVLLSLVMAAAVHVLYGGLWIARRAQVTRGARAQLLVLIGLFVALKAAAYWLDRYGIDFSQRGMVQTGASYTDVHAVLPAKTTLAVIAVICAVLFLAGAFRRSALLPAMGFGLLVLSAVLLGGVYPYIIQQFVVGPNQQVKERPYIAREISGTRAAYGVSGTRVISYPAVPTAKPAALAQQAAALPDLRVADPEVLSSAFQQLQQVKGYYRFPDVLAMDRYVIGSGTSPQDTIIGIRDMGGPPQGQENWINTHLIYTHGYGVVSALASSMQGDGDPQFTESNIPPSGQLNLQQPRVYFGYEGASYVIVGGRQPELDYPNSSSGGQQNNTYSGGGGVPIGSALNRLLFAVKFRQVNILLSSAIDSRSRMLFIRDPLARVAKVAPFLTLDGDVYPVVVHGQILWVVDGYTTTDSYPYSQRVGLGRATSSTYSPNGLAFGPGSQVNYIRNSVKATVNAYTGAVHLYQWGTGTTDPVLKAWMRAFPGVIQPERAIPSGLRPHLRYPEVLFDAQRRILAQYHVLQPEAFYGGQNFWAIPDDPTQEAAVSQPPYYLTLSMPGQSTPQFSLTTLFTPRGRTNLAAFMAVNSNPLSSGYGTITILQLPQNTAIEGPAQVQNNFESDPTASIELTQLRHGGSKVTLGNLVTVPLGGGLLSVEPVYVSASATTNTGSYPQLRRVFTYYEGQVGFADTLAGSLAQLFGALGQGPSSPGGGSGTVSAIVLQYLQQAEQYYGQAQTALRSGNLAEYYADILKMKKALDQASNAAQATSPGSSGSRPSPSPSPSP